MTGDVVRLDRRPIAQCQGGDKVVSASDLDTAQDAKDLHDGHWCPTEMAAARIIRTAR